MTLIAVQKNPELIKDGIILSDQQVQLGNIRVDSIGKGKIGKKGDRLYDLYSEELNNAKQEYILALEKEKILDHSIVDFKQLV
jgi:Cu(I)/Ag(I) efflux system membrane fusion protein